jgi:hypothetical protein
VTRITLLLPILLLPIMGITSEEPVGPKTQWLSWPVTGYPFRGVDSGILIPPAPTRFKTDVRRDVIIGLRDDGTVVWKYIQNSDEQPPPITEELPRFPDQYDQQ